jgi:hypothetical protein
MDAELGDSTLTKTFDYPADSAAADNDQGSHQSLSNLNVEYNLVRNLLKSQSWQHEKGKKMQHIGGIPGMLDEETNAIARDMLASLGIHNLDPDSDADSSEDDY